MDDRGASERGADGTVATKEAIRNRVWDDLESAGVARFPFPPHDRIPNFDGAAAAADRLAERPEWAAAGKVKSNPDAPQLPVRRRALETGKTVFMAVPRLREAAPFERLDPAEIDDTDAAATISHMDEFATAVGPEAMPRIDLIVAGSVAVTPTGDRIGKGEGYSDLEFAVLREAGLVDRDTTIVTTVHERQVVQMDVPTTPHDVPIEWVFTPERDIRTEAPGRKPKGIAWKELDEKRLEEIPILRQMEHA